MDQFCAQEKAIIQYSLRVPLGSMSGIHTLPEAQRTQGIESILLILELELSLLLKKNASLVEKKCQVKDYLH